MVAERELGRASQPHHAGPVWATPRIRYCIESDEISTTTPAPTLGFGLIGTAATRFGDTPSDAAAARRPTDLCSSNVEEPPTASRG